MCGLRAMMGVGGTTTLDARGPTTVPERVRRAWVACDTPVLLLVLVPITTGGALVCWWSEARIVPARSRARLAFCFPSLAVVGSCWIVGGLSSDRARLVSAAVPDADSLL
jgi:hypothetical protein